MLKKYIVFCFCVIINLVSSQTIEGLRQKLYSNNPDTLVNTHLKIGLLFSDQFSLSDSLLFHINKAKLICNSASKNDTKLKARCELTLAKYHFREGNFDTTLKILNKLPELNELLGELYLLKGMSLHRNNDNKQAHKFYLKALTEFTKNSNIDNLAFTKCKLGGLFLSENQFEEGLRYARETEAHLPQMKNPISKVSVYSALSGIYVNLGINQRTLLDNALEHALEAIRLVETNQFYSKGSQLCNSLSNIYYLKGDYAEALKYALKALQFRDYIQQNEILNYYLTISDCYNALKQNSSALLYLDSAFIYLPKLNDAYYYQVYFERLYAYNKDAGNIQKSLLALERFKAIQDSLTSNERTKSINELEQKYLRFENEQKISELQKTNEIRSLREKFLAVGIITMVLVVLVIVFFYRQYVLKSKYQALETELRLNRARMNPHFVFNALAGIQTLVLEGKEAIKISGMVSSLSKIMRQALESTYDEMLTLDEEIEFLENYLKIQSQRFESKFEYHFSIDENIHANDVMLPSMLLQPFIENSIEHGFKGLNRKGLIQILCKLKGNYLEIILNDNGIGLGANSTEKSTTSRATQIAKERLSLLNKKYKATSSISISKRKEGGVEVKILLPLIKFS